MNAVGITGHQSIPNQIKDYVLGRIQTTLTSQHFERAFSSLAVGADQSFADAAIELSIPLHAVLPCTAYESTFETADALASYQRLLAAADQIYTCDFESATEEAFWQAGRHVVESSDLLLAVWDGEPSRGLGGTADVVEYAKQLNKPVDRIWRPGVRR